MGVSLNITQCARFLRLSQSRNPAAGKVGCVCFQIPELRGGKYVLKGHSCVLVLPRMPSKQSCPRVNADQRGEGSGGKPIEVPTSLGGSVCPTSKVQMIFGGSVGLLPSSWAVDVLKDVERE